MHKHSKFETLNDPWATGQELHHFPPGIRHKKAGYETRRVNHYEELKKSKVVVVIFFDPDPDRTINNHLMISR